MGKFDLIMKVHNLRIQFNTTTDVDVTIMIFVVYSMLEDSEQKTAFRRDGVVELD